MNVTADDLKKLYERQTGQPWTPTEGGKWLRLYSVQVGDLGLYSKESVLQKSAHIDLSDKAGWLSQHYCRVCRPNGSVHTIPLRIKPESWQALGSIDKAAFKAAIARRLSGRTDNMLHFGHVCLSLLFVCSTQRKTKDLDNMAKLLIDSIKGIVMGDDKDVDHLSIMRLTHECDKEFIYFRISDSTLNEHKDVAELSMTHGWDRAELLLEDYRPSSPTAT